MKIKKVYTVPASVVLEMKPQGVVCASTHYIFLLTTDSSSDELDWGRNGYGTAAGAEW